MLCIYMSLQNLTSGLNLLQEMTCVCLLSVCFPGDVSGAVRRWSSRVFRSAHLPEGSG